MPADHPMTAAHMHAVLTDVQALACTAWAEARGDHNEGNSSVEERIAVMCVCRNRVRNPRRFADTYKGVCLARKQFSCWNPGPDANHKALMALVYRLVTHQPLMDPLADECLFLAGGVISGVILDRTGGADHYFAPQAMVPFGRRPSWAKTLTPLAIIGDQEFYHIA